MMPRNPLVTVYVVNHNYGRYVEQAVESVLRQTLTDFELIIIDDGSTDHSREVIERYDGRDRIVAVFQHNKGLTVANNIALRLAKGKYVMRLDADDYLDENALAILSGVLEREPNIGLVFPDYYRVDHEGLILDTVRRHDFDSVTLLDQPAHGACTLIRRECLETIGGYDEEFSCQDGYDLWLRFIQHYGVKNVNLPLFYYRQHPGSLSRNEEVILATRSQILEKQSRRNGHALHAAAIIPVRGHTADPHSTVMQPFGNRPLIDWTVEAALQAKLVSGVVVTTPDNDLLDHVGRTFGDRVILVRRDRSMARINTPYIETLLQAQQAYAEKVRQPDAIVVLGPESPFRGARHVDSAIEVMTVYETDSVIAVRPEIDTFFQHSGHGLTPLRPSQNLRLESEELYRETGQMRIVNRRILEQERNTIGGRVGHIVIDRKAGLQLTTRWDWHLAELLLAHGDPPEIRA